ncbi:transglycosylase SLT domain-containing protein [Photorhabdus sp. RM71S]|uniref:transglycosylase SLT domain-containing protein n=1 Tax=Photorhabdus sp. RM71S TaxID=3342824 RepID=UPI0036DEC9A4
MATLIDTLLVSLKLDGGSFESDSSKAIKSNDKLAKSADNVSKSSGGASGAMGGFSDSLKRATKKSDDFSQSINNGIKALTGLFSAIFVSTGLTKLVNDISRSNDQLNFLSKNLGMSADTIKKWQNVAEMSGGSADGMAASMTSLSKSLWDLVTVGDASILPYFNALGVGVVDASGKIRNLDDILIDVADSLSKLERPQAYNIAKSMGFDEGTINTLLQGRDAIQKRLDAQKNLVISTKEELELNRKLREQNSILGQQWEGLKTIVANYLIPHLLTLTAKVTGFFEYLNKHRDTALNIFKTLSVFLAATLIPVLWRVGAVMLAAFAPLFGTTGLILALAAAFLLLYDDYQTWAKGGKSLFDWSSWSETIEMVLRWLKQLGEWFKSSPLSNWFKDTNGEIDMLKVAFAGFATYLGTKWLKSILGTFGEVSKAAKNIKIPGGKGGKLGVAGRAGFIGMAAAAAYESEEYIDSALNWAFGKYDLFQRFRSAPDWKSAGLALIGEGDAKWVGGKWVDNRYKKSYKTSITPTTLDIPTGDPEIDELKAKILKGELILNDDGTITEPSRKSTSKGGEFLDSMAGTFASLEKRYNLPPGLLRGVAMTESTGNPNAIGPQTKYGSAKGMFQFIDSTARSFGLTSDDVFNPDKSAEAAAKYLSQMLKTHNGDIEKALASYNWGIGNVQKYGMDMMPKETRDYIPRVRKYMSDAPNDQQKGTGFLNSIGGFSQSIAKLQDSINKPLVSNMDIGANQFLAQTNKIGAQPVSNVNNVKVDLNGDINVQTTASTITGTVSEASQAAREYLSQIIPSMG